MSYKLYALSQRSSNASLVRIQSGSWSRIRVGVSAPCLVRFPPSLRAGRGGLSVLCLTTGIWADQLVITTVTALWAGKQDVRGHGVCQTWFLWYVGLSHNVLQLLVFSDPSLCVTPKMSRETFLSSTKNLFCYFKCKKNTIFLRRGLKRLTIVIRQTLFTKKVRLQPFVVLFRLGTLNTVLHELWRYFLP